MGEERNITDKIDRVPIDSISIGSTDSEKVANAVVGAGKMIAYALIHLGKVYLSK